MPDYSKYEKAFAEPDASSMIETFRAIGYSIESAVADIIDNSVSAGAKNIWFDYEWKGEATTVSIIDDGCGMSNDELINAMRPGSRSPLDLRDSKDLGRFGMGLKTASFSQCKKFSVISKIQSGETSWWCWDLDYVNEVKSWSLVRYLPDEIFLDKVGRLPSGTAVVWWEIDRLTRGTQTDSEESLDKFMRTMDAVKKHLSMVFHRYLGERLKIHFRGREIEPWDPFMIGAEGMQVKSDVHLDGRRILVKGFILPHRSKLTPTQYNYGKGPKDSWTAHQGFYVYRNKRLLVAGDWLGVGNFKQEVHYDLCRIMIDLPNDCDAHWQIDIKKSIARPPLGLRGELLSVAKEVRAQAVEVYRHKGKIIRRNLSQTEDQFLWEDYKRHGKRFYKINRRHPVLKRLLESAVDYRAQIEAALRFIEETVPVPLITLRENENETPHGQPFEEVGHEIIHETIRAMYRNLVNTGKSGDQAKSIILGIEPFNSYPHYVAALN